MTTHSNASYRPNRQRRNSVPAPQWREPLDVRPNLGPVDESPWVIQPADEWLVGEQVEDAFADSHPCPFDA